MHFSPVSSPPLQLHFSPVSSPLYNCTSLPCLLPLYNCTSLPCLLYFSHRYHSVREMMGPASYDQLVLECGLELGAFVGSPQVGTF